MIHGAVSVVREAKYRLSAAAQAFAKEEGIVCSGAILKQSSKNENKQRQKTRPSVLQFRPATCV